MMVLFIGGPLDGRLQQIPDHIERYKAAALQPNLRIEQTLYRLERMPLRSAPFGLMISPDLSLDQAWDRLVRCYMEQLSEGGTR